MSRYSITGRPSTITSSTTNSDDQLESIISDFDQIYQDFKHGITTIQSLQSSYNAEIKKREALQFTANSLKSENERLLKLYTGSINKLSDQLERQANSQCLKEELKRATEEHVRRENELTNAMDLLKQDHENRIKHMETQIRDFVAQKTANELTISQLHQSLASHRNHIDSLGSRFKHIHSDMELKYKNEIQDLKDCLMVEQEEKIGLTKKLQHLEKQLLISSTKLVENKQGFTSNRQVETLKQKIMKLRKENEVLKRQLLNPNEE